MHSVQLRGLLLLLLRNMRSNMKRSVSFIVSLSLQPFLVLDFVSFEVLIFSLELGNFVSELGDMCLGRLNLLLEILFTVLKSKILCLKSVDISLERFYSWLSRRSWMLLNLCPSDLKFLLWLVEFSLNLLFLIRDILDIEFESLVRRLQSHDLQPEIVYLSVF